MKNHDKLFGHGEMTVFTYFDFFLKQSIISRNFPRRVVA